MNYPPSIYSNFKIIEKDIYGEKHYGLVKHYKVFGVRFKRHLKIGRYDFISLIGGSRWFNDKKVIMKAIVRDNMKRELNFEVKVTK